MSWTYLSDYEITCLANGEIPPSDPVAVARARAILGIADEQIERQLPPATESNVEISSRDTYEELDSELQSDEDLRRELEISIDNERSATNIDSVENQELISSTTTIAPPTLTPYDKLKSTKPFFGPVIGVPQRKSVELGHVNTRPPETHTAPTVATIGKYEFHCDGWEALTNTNDQALVDELTRLMREVSTHSGKARYLLYRARICQLNLALNCRRAIAPRFRPEVRPSHICAPGSIDEILSRDRQVVDLHWLHETGHRRVIETRSEFRDLMVSDSLDFEEIEKFACLRWKLVTKYEALGLTYVRAAELAAIQPDSLRIKWKAIDTKQHRWHTRLSDIARANQTKHFSEWVAVRSAIELIGATTPLQQLCRLVSLMTGDAPIDERGMARKRETVLKYLPL